MPHDTGWRRSKPWPNHRRIKANSPCISNQQMKINESPGKIGHAGLLEADGSAGGTERLFDLAVGGKPVDVTIYQS